MWLFFGVVACFFWAIENIGTKYFIGNKIGNPFVFQILFTFGFLTSLLVVPFIGFQWPDFQNLLWIILAAALYFYGALPYVKALQEEEVTRVVLLWNLIPIITMAVGWYFNNDVLAYFEIVGVLFLILGAILATIKKETGKIKFSRAFLLMFISCICYSFYYVIVRQVSKTISISNIFVSVAILNCFFATTLFFSKKLRWETKKYLFKFDKKLFFSLLGLSIVSDLGILSNQLAISLKPGAIVSALIGFQMLFVFIMAVGISYKNPMLLREDLSKRSILLKIGALILMIVGTMLVSY